MTDAIAAAGSGLRAMSASMAVAAGNVANAATDGYTSREAVLSSGPDGQGVQVSLVDEDTATAGSTAQDAAAAGPSAPYPPELAALGAGNVDLVGESVNMIAASRAFEADVAVLRSADEMAGTLLDLRV